MHKTNLHNRHKHLYLVLFLPIACLWTLTLSLTTSAESNNQYTSHHVNTIQSSKTNTADLRHAQTATQSGATPQFNLMWVSTQTHKGSIDVADLNGDGHLDILGGTHIDFHTDVIYLNNGRGSFTDTYPVEVIGGSYPHDYNVADIDGDGDLDFIVNFVDLYIRIFENLGDGKFLRFLSGDLSIDRVNGDQSSWGDVDGDGDIDILTIHDDKVRIYENELDTAFGDKVFNHATPSILSEIDGVTAVTWGDIDQDNDLDIIAAGLTNTIYLNQGDITFTPLTAGDFITNDIGAHRIELGDMDADHDLDLVVIYKDATVTNQVFENDGTGVMTNVTGGDLLLNLNDKSYDVDWGDVDQDGDLDLLVGNNGEIQEDQQSRVYRNDGNGVFIDISAGDFAADFGDIRGSTWGDMDADGDLDIVLSNHNGKVVIYQNDLGYAFTHHQTISTTNPSGITHISWGDINQDQTIDLIAGSLAGSTVFTNSGDGTFQPIVANDLETQTGEVCSNLFADFNGDNQLDVFVADTDGNQLYYGDGAEGFTVANGGALTTEDPLCTAVSGDIGSDGDLDLLGIQQGSAKLYIQGEDSTFTTVTPPVFNSFIGTATTVSWNDIDQDHDLDILVGGSNGVELYRNDGGVAFTNITSGDLAAVTDGATAAVSGDIDADGDLDLIIGYQNSTAVYQNNGNNTFTNVTTGDLALLTATSSLDIGDIDGDGDLDLLMGTQSGQSKLFRNDGSGLFSDVTAGDLAVDTNTNGQVALADADKDGDLDAWVGTAGKVKIYLNRQHIAMPPQKDIPRTGVNVLPPANIPEVAGYGTAEIVDNLIIPIPYNLWRSQADHIGHIEAWFSTNGGGTWQPAIATSDTVTQNLQAGAWPTSTQHTYYWDTFASGLFGQSDNTIFRIVAYPHPITGTVLRQYSYTNTMSFPSMYGSAVASSTPFRLRSTQIQVFTGTTAAEQPLSNTVVYQKSAEDSQASQITDETGTAVTTNEQGYLVGSGNISVGDELFALYLVTQTGALDFYHMSSVPTLSSLQGDTVTAPGIQKLVVSATNPLLVANLDISLEWDARQDTVFLTQLERNIERAAESLFDISNGQLTLGEITIYHDQEQWQDSHIQIYASNSIRPNVDLGGIISEPLSATLSTGEIVPEGYVPGQVRMPREWNRFGNAGGNSGTDWAMALSHELAHYIFFVPDNYLGIDEIGRLVQTDCQGSVMTDPYLDTYSEFLTGTVWQTDGECLRTVAENTTGRSDWETINHFYPALNTEGGNPGPYSLPLDITQVRFVEPTATAVALDNPIFFIKNELGQSLPLSNGQVDVYRHDTNNTETLIDDRLVRLGSTNGDIVNATGIEPGDKLCIQDNSTSTPRRGCTAVSQNSATIALTEFSTWSPLIDSNQVNSQTLQLTVTQANVSNPLHIQIYPTIATTNTEFIIAPHAELTPINGSNEVYTAEITFDAPFFMGDIRIWEDNTQKEEISTIFLGGSWPSKRYSWGTKRYSWGTKRYSWGVSRLGWNAPTLSSDGQVMLFELESMFGDSPPYSMQSRSSTTGMPGWLTPVGEIYEITTPDAFTGTKSILFNYLQKHVPSTATEGDLQIYYRPLSGSDWQPLDTAINPTRNIASALMPGEGEYALVSTVILPALQSDEWNLFGYPILESRPITSALASIDGAYSIVYSFDPIASKWLVYDPNIPSAFRSVANTLHELEYGRGYWIYATEQITPYLGVGSDQSRASESNIISQPMVVYGVISQTETVTPTQGMVVTAQIEQQLCGTGEVMQHNNQWVYRIEVDGRQNGGTNCGQLNDTVSLRFGNSIETETTVTWDNRQILYHPIGESDTGTPPTSDHQIYLPLIIRP